MRYGYIDKSGKLVIPLRYRMAGEFSEGRAFVLTTGRQLQLIDKSATVIATFPYKVGDYDSMPVISEGYAAPSISWHMKDVAWGFIGRDGKIAFPHLDIWSIKAGFSDGLAWVGLNKSDDAVCIDTNDKERFRVPNVSQVMSFKHGIFAVQKRGERGIAYYNTVGKLIWKSAE